VVNLHMLRKTAHSQDFTAILHPERVVACAVDNRISQDKSLCRVEFKRYYSSVRSDA